jgi:hypothetical protein
MGFFDIDTRTKRIFILDQFPRRLNRDNFRTASQSKSNNSPRAADIFQQLPQELVKYWERVALELLDQSSAKFVLLIGTEARIAYEQHMRANKDFTFETASIPTFLDGSKHTKGQQNTKLRPFAHLELDKDSKIKRIVIPIHHLSISSNRAPQVLPSRTISIC